MNAIRLGRMSCSTPSASWAYVIKSDTCSHVNTSGHAGNHAQLLASARAGMVKGTNFCIFKKILRNASRSFKPTN